MSVRKEFPEVQGMLPDGGDLSDVLYDMEPAPFCSDCDAPRGIVRIISETARRIFYYCDNCHSDWEVKKLTIEKS